MKDPAFLFYPNDFIGGTMGMTIEQKGAYMELLMMQFNHGKFTETQAKQVLSTCSASAWDVVREKFDTDGTFFWNKRLKDEIDRRKKFTESRRINALGGKKNDDTSVAHAELVETETETINKNRTLGEIKNENIKILKGEIYLESVCMQKNTDMETVLDILNTFIIDQDLCDGLNRPIQELKSHFLNTLKLNLKDRPKVRTYDEWLKDNKLEDSELNRERHKKHREIWDEHKRKN